MCNEPTPAVTRCLHIVTLNMLSPALTSLLVLLLQEPAKTQLLQLQSGRLHSLPRLAFCILQTPPEFIVIEALVDLRSHAASSAVVSWVKVGSHSLLLGINAATSVQASSDSTHCSTEQANRSVTDHTLGPVTNLHVSRCNLSLCSCWYARVLKGGQGSQAHWVHNGQLRGCASQHLPCCSLLLVAVHCVLVPPRPH